jgi:hypothetical protein
VTTLSAPTGGIDYRDREQHDEPERRGRLRALAVEPDTCRDPRQRVGEERQEGESSAQDAGPERREWSSPGSCRLPSENSDGRQAIRSGLSSTSGLRTYRPTARRVSAAHTLRGWRAREATRCWWRIPARRTASGITRTIIVMRAKPKSADSITRPVPALACCCSFFLPGLTCWSLQ